MIMKRAYGRIEGDHLILPPEVLEILPKGGQVYMVTDSERGCVTAFSKDLTNLGDPELFAALAQLNAGQSAEEYLQPVPPEQLQRRKRKANEGGQ